MFVKYYNNKGKEAGKIELPKNIFDVKMSPDLVHQIVVQQMANRRQVLAHTKTRGEVRGGGKKPWRQKGTGRARHGSIRSPLWRGGGITFGPRKEKVFKKKISKKTRKKALFMVLTAKLKENLLIFLEELKNQETKTKKMVEILKNFNLENKSVIIILPDLNKNVILTCRNIPKITTIQAKDLNCLDLLSYKYLLIPKESIKKIQETFTL